MPQSRCSSPIIVALDFATAKQACDFAKQINPENTRLKVGKALFTQAGPALLTELHQLGFEVFLDLKFHDIPNTVANACLEAANLGVWMINVHASGGRPMLETVMNRLQTLAQRPKVIAVTVLTSMSQTTFHEIGFIGNIEEQVLHLARLSQIVVWMASCARHAKHNPSNNSVAMIFY